MLLDPALGRDKFVGRRYSGGASVVATPVVQMAPIDLIVTMRCALAAIAFVGLPVLAGAQSRALEPGQVPPLPPIGLPLPTIGIAHPPMGLPRVSTSEVELPVSGPRGHRRHGHRKLGSQPAYLLPILMWPVPLPTGPSEPGSQASTVQRTAIVSTRGWLRLDMQPRSEPGLANDVQVFVDGVYQGVFPDVEDGLELDAGPHALEIRAPGYDPHTIPVSIAANRATRYRATLTPIGTPSAPVGGTPVETSPRSPKVPTTFYEIPGCYLGNIPPAEAALPRGCDINRSRTITR